MPLLKRKHAKSGLTLIEILLVVSILSTVSLAVYHIISDGISLWKRAQRYALEEDVAIFLEKISVDLRNAYSYSLLSFTGKKDILQTPTIIYAPVDKHHAAGRAAMADQMGLSEYSWDSATRAIYLRQANYGQAMDESFGPKKILVRPVKSLTFVYQFIEEGKPVFKKAADGILPVAVRIDVEISEVGGGVRKLSRLVNIPMGG